MKWLSRFAVIAALMLPVSAFASQGSGCMPTSGTVSGLTLVQDINAANAAFISMNSGATAPTTDCTGVSITGQMWLDTGTSLVKVYDGSSWLPLGKVDASSHVWTPRIGGGAASIIANTTVDLGSVAPGFVTITSNTTITGFSNTAEVGTIKLLRFTGTPILTHSVNLILPTAANIQVVAGDQAAAVYLGGNVWSVWAYTRADGTTLSSSNIFIGSVFFNSPISPALTATVNDWNPTSLSIANVIRVSSNGVYYITGITAPATNGKVLEIVNVGSFSIRLPNESTSSSAANRFTLRAPIELTPGRSVMVIYDSTTARWRLMNEPTGYPVAGGFTKLKIVNNTGSPTTIYDITADQVTLDEVGTGRAYRVSSVSVSPDMTASGANGLDTGTIVNNIITWYYGFVIFNPTTEVTAGMYSLQSSCASVTMPAGYTYCARAGAMRTDGAATARWIRTIQQGRSVQYVLTGANSLPTVASGILGTYSSTAPSWSSASLATRVPPTAYRAKFIIQAANSSGGTSSYNVAPNGSYLGYLAASNPAPIGWNGSGGNPSLSLEIDLETQNVFVNSSAAAFAIFIWGWTDNL